MLGIIRITAFPLRSAWVPSGFPRKKWVPFINMHNGRVNDIIYCYNLGFLHTNEVPSCIIIFDFLHTNKRRIGLLGSP